MQDDSDFEDEESNEYKPDGKDGIIFMVDANSTMFEEDESGMCPFRMCLKACDEAILHKIMHSQYDLISVVFFGTEISKNDSNLKHIYIFEELKRPGAEMLKKIRTMHESSTLDDFETKYGHSDDYLFADVLWLARSMYNKNSTSLSTPRILLLTCSDTFGKEDPHSKRQAITGATDLHGHSISLDIIPCSTNYQPSDLLKTLMGIVSGESGPWSLPKMNQIHSLEDICNVVVKIAASKDQRARCLGHIPFKIGDGVTIKVEIYNLFRKCNLPPKTKLDRVSNEVVKSTVTHVKFSVKEVVSDLGGSAEEGAEKITLSCDSKQILMKYEMGKCQDVGGETVKFTQDEIKQMRNLLTPGLILLGFVPVSLLKKTHHCGESSLVYPDKSSTSGARDLFSGLWLKMGEKKVAAICSYKIRNGTLPHFVALVPSGMDENEIMKIYEKYNIPAVPDPQGFHLLFLPFADNINSLGLTEKPSAYPHQIDKAFDVLKKLRNNYHPSLFPNPVLDTHWAAIEAIALDRPAVKEIVDETKPDYEVMDERLGELADEFLECVYSPGYDPNGKVGKKSTPTSMTEIEIDIIEAAIRKKKVATLTVNQLKGYLKLKGIPITGKRKDALVGDIYKLFGNI